MRPNRPLSAYVAVLVLVTVACNAGTPTTTSSPPTTPISSTVIEETQPPAPSASPNTAPQVAGQIVFVDNPVSSGHRQVYIEAADGSNVRRLVTSEADDVSPSFSPDGRMVVFSMQSDQGQILVVNVDGSGLRQLKPGGCPARRICDDEVEGHAWSPDGSRIVFTRAIFDKIPPADTFGNVALWVMKADGSDAHQITLAGLNADVMGTAGAQDDEAGWSPDSSRIVFLRHAYTSPERYGIFTVAADGTDLRRVTPVTIDAADPDWSPDGTEIAFQTPPDPTPGTAQNIYVIHPDGSGLTQLTDHLSLHSDHSDGTFHPSWSPDGTEIVFSHDPSSSNGTSDLFVMNRDGSGVRVIRINDAQNENQPFWGRTP